MNTKFLTILLVLLIVLGGCDKTSTTHKEKNQKIKIGIITDLSGPASYWGESTLAGVNLAQTELRNEGYNIEVFVEDFAFDTKQALSTAGKLVTFDKVDALYVELAPGVVPVSSYMKDKNILAIYASPLEVVVQSSPYAYKSYLNYKTGCKDLAEKFKDEGIETMGVLKMNIAAGEK